MVNKLLSPLSKLNVSYDSRGKRIRRTKTTVKAAIPAIFHEKLLLWRELVKYEIQSETETIKGLALGNLTLISDSFHPVLGQVVEFKKNERTTASKIFREGAPLVICKGSNLEHIGQCVFLSQSEGTLKVLLNSDLQLVGHNGFFSLIPSTNAATLQKIEDFLYGFKRLKELPGFYLLRVAYRSLPMPTFYNDRNLKSYPATFNESQKRAVDAGLNPKRPLVVIHGPPGTGKTAVVCEIIIQAAKQNQKVLVCAPSHLAVDTILGRVKDFVGVCRIGSHAEGTLDSLVSSDIHYEDLVKLTDEMNLARETMPERNKWKFYKLRQQAKSLRLKIERDILNSKEVIFSTLMSGSLRRLCKCGYVPDLMIIDEAAQAYECVTWLAMMCARRCILAGDHHQLSALVQSPRWSSDQFYDGKLQAHDSVANSTLSDICNISQESPFNEPLIMLDTYSSKVASGKEEFFKMSYKNEDEAMIVVDCVKFLESSGLTRDKIGVITPYYAQVSYLQKMLDPDIVRTVDGFQGQQKEVIILSLVRDNYSGDIGFLKDSKRLNVAVTRAKKQFILIGNSRMMSHSACLQSLFNYIRKLGVVISVRDSSGLLRRVNSNFLNNASRVERRSGKMFIRSQ